jgi:hypothetical protein
LGQIEPAQINQEIDDCAAVLDRGHGKAALQPCSVAPFAFALVPSAAIS